MPDTHAINRYWMFALDPLHFGSGSEQLTAIDLPVVREQGTGLPVAPGSSLTGSCRAYCCLQNEQSKNCAGKGGESGDGHCGACAVCFAFGFSNGKDKKSREGLARISTAHIIAFPLASNIGPVWITSREQLQLAGVTLAANVKPPNPDSLLPLTAGKQPAELLLGCWHVKAAASPAQLPDVKPIAVFTARGVTGANLLLADHAKFVQLVNDNLEVRTLVSINPKTGAAESGALFTYEAIPRGTLLYFDVTYLKPDLFGVETTIATMADTLKSGFDLMKFLGVGGMNTRGFGRVHIEAFE